MTIWVDAQLSPWIARWMATNFPVTAAPLRDLGLRDAEDDEIFAAARIANAIMLTKDSDFAHLLERQGSPPKIIWLTCGNTSERELQRILSLHLAVALGLLADGEELVEIGSL